MVSRWRHLAWVLVASALLMAGCATPKSTAHTTKLWEGRLSLTLATEPRQSFFAAFELSGDAHQGQLRLLSPIGSTLAELVWNPTSARLTQGSQTQTGPSADALLALITGTTLPTAALFDWLNGLPTPTAGWQADLSQSASGVIRVQRAQPLPAMELRLQLDPTP